ncbi:MAG: sigma-70 family RNA polymerase sigma factor [Cytophagales bacterium]|nr:MAG: sigma-70 family RNA polymerase sigma factor [Cytophagales bacterium]
MTDIDIIEGIRKGDEKLIDFLYKKNYKMMVNLIVKNNGSEEEARDIYQEALIILWQKAKSDDFVLSSKISTYLYSVCMNLWRKELERKSRHTNDAIEKGEYLDNDKNESARIIHECINSLGDTCKQILMYYYFDEMSMNDIAEKLGFANADTAKTRKYKCKQELDKLVKSRYSAKDFQD